MDNLKHLEDFKSFLQIDKSLSENSVSAYISDVEKLLDFVANEKSNVSVDKISLNDLKEFVGLISLLGIAPRSQARIISGIRAFFKYLLLDDVIQSDPSLLLEMPLIGKKLPVFLSIEEIDLLESSIDLSKPEGHRNRAIIETLYSCGLRVSELINLKLTNLFFEYDFIKVTGKGDKERLVPISEKAKSEINLYTENYRNQIAIKRGFENFVFLNRRGQKLSRVMVFIIVKELAEIAGLDKNISPHTFRHSFATHLVDGGADLRAVQEMLGHESIITTEIYTHLSKEFLRQTIIDYHPRSIKQNKKNHEK
jgi:integrase/recombinase XerD